jgi:electron transfer flavoprotein alpha subunit
MTEHEQPSPRETAHQIPHPSSESSGVWFVAEVKGGAADESCFKLCAEARGIADRLGESVAVVILGSGVGEVAGPLGAYGADTALVVDNPHLETYAGETYTEVLAQLITAGTPSIVLLAATTVGEDLAPRLAARLEAVLVAHYTEFEIDPQRNVTVRRSVHGGNAQATLLPRRRPIIATIDTQILSEPKPKQRAVPDAVEAQVWVDPKSSLTRIIDYLRADPCAVCVSEAEIVIGIGKGLGCAENVHAVEDLARVLGASIGGSRRATDERWIADERRIGMTGKTIAPRLYLICGISGAFHHTLSIKESKFKVVINTDANAPISKMADLMVVGDMQQVIPELTRQLREMMRPTG